MGWGHHLLNSLNRGAYVLAHAAVAVILILVFWGIQNLLLWAGDPKLFDWIPLRYIFDVMEVGLLVAFIVFGTIEAFAVFRENDHA